MVWESTAVDRKKERERLISSQRSQTETVCDWLTAGSWLQQKGKREKEKIEREREFVCVRAWVHACVCECVRMCRRWERLCEGQPSIKAALIYLKPSFILLHINKLVKNSRSIKNDDPIKIFSWFAAKKVSSIGAKNIKKFLFFIRNFSLRLFFKCLFSNGVQRLAAHIMRTWD